MLWIHCKMLSGACWVVLLALIECMPFQGSGDVSYSQYFCALSNIQLILARVVRYYLFVLLNIFCIFLPTSASEKFFQDRPLDIEIGDILFVNIADKSH
jgi:hypothetical protein